METNVDLALRGLLSPGKLDRDQ